MSALTLVLDLLRAGRLAEAADQVEALVTQGAAGAETLHLAGVIALQRGQRQRALGFLERSVAAPDTTTACHVTYATALRVTGRLTEAVAVLQRAQSLTPGTPTIAAPLAEALQALGRTDAAIACLEEHLGRYPADGPARLALAGLLADHERRADALALVQAALPLLPGEDRASRTRAAALLMRLSAAATALPVLRRLCVQQPAVPATWNDLGMAWRALGRVDRALPALDRARRLAPEDDRFAFNRAVILEQGGSPTADAETVLAAYREALRLRPRAAGHWSKLLGVLARSGRLEEMAAHLAAFVQVRAAYGFFWKEPYYGLLTAVDERLEAGDRERAEAVLHRALAAFAPLDPLLTDWVRFLLGSLHLRRGEAQVGQTLLRAAFRRLPFLEHVCLGDRFAERLARVADAERVRFEAALVCESLGEADTTPPAGVETVVLCACDPVYLRRFGAVFALSIDLFANAGVLLHVHVVEPDARTPADLQAIRNRLRSVRLAYSWERLVRPLPPAERRTYYTCVRFLRLPQLLTLYQRPLVVADIDAVFLGDPRRFSQSLTQDQPLALLFAPKTLAYLYDAVGGGLLAALPTEPVQTVFERIRTFLLSWLLDGSMHYFLDQVALSLGVGAPDWPELALGVRPFERRGAEVALNGTGFVQMRLEKADADFDRRLDDLVQHLTGLRAAPEVSAAGLRFALRRFVGTA